MGQVMSFAAKKQVLRTGVVAVAIMAVAGIAAAAGFSIREQSAEGQGASFAGVAAGTNGPSSMFWNPATMTQHNAQGYSSESNVTLIAPTSHAKDGAGFIGDPDSGNIANTELVPASYSVYGLTDDITIGLAMNAPFGLSTNSDRWVGSLHGDESAVKTLNVNPNIAYKFNDMLSVAVGVQAEYMKVKLTSDAPTGQIFGAKADDIGVGFTAGVLFQPSDATAIGLGFRSSVSHSLKGDGTFVPTGYDGDVAANFDSPELVTLGLRQKVNDDLTLMAGVEWANWSRFKSLDIKLDDGSTLSTTEKWKDSWFFSLGAEYAVNDQLTVRGGLAYENSGVTGDTRTPRLPDNDRYWASIGASYQVNDWITANLAYSYVFMKDGDIDLAAAGTLPALSADFKQHIQIVSASATLDW